MAEGQDPSAALPSLRQFVLTKGLGIYTQEQGIFGFKFAEVGRCLFCFSFRKTERLFAYF